MNATYLVNDERLKDELIKLGYKIEYEYPGEWYFICTKNLLIDVPILKKELANK